MSGWEYGSECVSERGGGIGVVSGMGEGGVDLAGSLSAGDFREKQTYSPILAGKKAGGGCRRQKEYK